MKYGNYDERLFKQAEDEGITIVNKLISSSTLEVAKEIMSSPDFGGSSDWQTIDLIYNMIILTRASKILEIGTWLGFGGLYFLDALDKSKNNNKKIYVTIDNNSSQQQKAKNFFNKAGFSEMVEAVPFGSDTEEAKSIAEKNQYYDIMYIDSLHDYQQTKMELNSYFKYLKKGGLLFCHDTSMLAVDYDTKKEGGVRGAISEFIQKQPIQGLFVDPEEIHWNPVGLFMGQKKV